LKNVNGSIETVSGVKDMFIKLGDYYSETLGQALIVNPPFTISILWNFLKVFLAKSTVEKFVFISGTQKKFKTQIQKYISSDNLISHYGGDATFNFDFEKTLKEEVGEKK
jgi:hypothetical protein